MLPRIKLTDLLIEVAGWTWNTVYLTKATAVIKDNGLFREKLMQHISPLGWEHINFLGEYSFDINRTTKLGSLKPLIK